MRPDRENPYSATIHIAIILALALFFWSAAPAAAQTTAGTVSSVSGQVQIQHNGATAAATVGATVSQSDRIITGADGHVVIILSDQSKLELGGSTSISLDQYTSGGATPTRVSLFSGVMRSLVNATGGPANYQVHTPNAIAAVRGTKFDVGYSEGSVRPGYDGCDRYTDTAVLEGTVNLTNAANPDSGSDIQAGYEATVPCGQSVSAAGPLAMTGAFSSGGGSNGFTGPPPSSGGAPPPACPVCAGNM
ncbi:MAG TPA: FecR family protein [Candidatus Binataceae bacterium]|nr:FecR family protein [Candidatus Binataceae bacterium]